MDWIDVREKLPDKLGVYEVTIYNVFRNKPYVATARFEPTSGEWIRAEKSGVVTAWKEMDEPYQRKVGPQ
ncbi:MAG: hypothetical protein LUD72_06940 [Bacteroidales bacterium]|nr:hypothetical protein [Bacteroidales bacterium]